MTTAAFPSVITAIMSVADATLTDVRVVRGRDVSQEFDDVVQVGIQDIEDLSWTSAGSFRQTMQTFGGNREEVGTVNCLVKSRNGDADQDAACSAAFGHIAALETAIRADTTLGLTAFNYLVAEMDSGEVRERQSDDGATAVMPFVITYKARI